VSAQLEQAVAAAVAADPLVQWRVCVVDATTDEHLVCHDADTEQASASLGKLLLLVEVAAQFDDGTLAEAELLAHGDDDWVDDSGLWWHLTARALPAVDCATLVGAFSDNLATNVLLRRVGGPEVVRNRARTLGIKDISLHRYVGLHAKPRPAVESPFGLSSGTASGYAALLARLHRRVVVSAAVSERVLGWLALNADLSMVGGAFDLDPLCHDEPDLGVQLWNKTGTICDVRGDVGVVAGGTRTMAYAVLTRWDDASHPAGRAAALDGMERIGRALRGLVRSELSNA
jgi:beta-lactamase class A